MEHEKFLKVLDKELVVALGCTEPIAIAFAAAMARKHVKGEKVEEVKAEPKKRGRKPKAEAVKAEPKKRGRKPKVKTEVATAKKTEKVSKKKVAKTPKVKEPKKRGRKPKPVRKSIKTGKGEDKVKWIDLIYDILRTQKSLMLSNSLTLAAMERLGIADADKDRVRMAISTNLTRLTKYDKTINKYSQEGTSGSFYGLAEWFDDKGKLKAEFKNKLM